MKTARDEQYAIVVNRDYAKQPVECTPFDAQDLATFADEDAGKADGTPFIQLGSNATLKGIAVFDPDQKEANPPVAYPWTVSSSLHGADLCNRAVHVMELQGHSGVRFVNSQICGDIIVEPSNHGPVQFTACGFFGSALGSHGVSLARIDGGGKVSFTDCHIHCIDPRATARPLIHAKAGRLQVRGCEILDGHAARDHVVLEPDVAYAVISDNIGEA